MSEYSTSFQPFGSGNEVKVPENKYSKLCSCVFCWEFSSMKNCFKCEKLFCQDHKNNHLCFYEKIISKESILARSYTDPVEVIAI